MQRASSPHRKSLLASREGAPDAPLDAFKGISEEFEELRWFWLPECCVDGHAVERPAASGAPR